MAYNICWLLGMWGLAAFLQQSWRWLGCYWVPSLLWLISGRNPARLPGRGFSCCVWGGALCHRLPCAGGQISFPFYGLEVLASLINCCEKWPLGVCLCLCSCMCTHTQALTCAPANSSLTFHDADTCGAVFGIEFCIY